MFKTEYQKLNPEQKRAVDAIYGPVMVLAGPGTGKTQVIALRIANILLKTDTSAKNILCLTFTNSGVKAMRDRLANIVGPEAYKINIHTFHSFCSELIKFNSERFLFAKKIAQTTDIDEINLIRRLLDEKSWKLIKTPKSPYHYLSDIRRSISVLKQEGVTPREYADIVKSAVDDLANNDEYYRQEKLMAKYQSLAKRIDKNRELAKFYANYVEEMRESGRYDYNDMIAFVLAELNQDAQWRASLQEKYQFLLVDEYQDTNGAQNELIELMGRKVEKPNIFVVGDDDQSIYRFQGANKENLLYFNHLYPEANKIILKINYRSSLELVAASQSLIEKSQERVVDDLGLTKQMKSATGRLGQKIYEGGFPAGEVERWFIVSEINRLLSKGVKPEEIAIFYRNNNEAEDLIPILTAHKITFKRLGGENVIYHYLISQLLQIMTLLNNFHDDVLMHRVMYFDCWQIEPAEIMLKVNQYYQSRQKSFYVWLKDNLTDTSEKLQQMLASMEEMVKLSANLNLVMLFEQVLDKTGMMSQLLEAKKYNDLAILRSFFDYLKGVNANQPNLTLEQWLKDVAVLQEYGVEIKKNDYDMTEAVNLMTAHKSKGLEFEYVFIYRAVDKHWSNKQKRQQLKLLDGVLREQHEEDHLEEERRLFYVAMTRAKRGLYMTSAENYFEKGDRPYSPTSFIKEIDEKWIADIDVDRYFAEKDKWMRIVPSVKTMSMKKAEKDLLKSLVADFVLSPTALNNYLQCPRKFMYDSLLRVPSAKELSASYGTAMHEALENFFTVYKKTKQRPDLEILLDFYESALQKVGMRSNDFREFREKGREDLSGYYHFYQSEMIAPVYNEYDFGQGRVRLDDKIPLTGKLDRVELIPGGQEQVRVIDYKTGKPKSRRAVQGLTKNDENNYWNQLVFYQLLGDLSDQFPYQIAEAELDFVEANQSGKYVKHRFSISSQDVNNLKELIREVWGKINRLEFGCTADNAKCRGGYGQRDCNHISYCLR